jgi:chromosome segregation ATPase
MSRFDNAPVEPTCNTIDKILDYLKEAKEEIKDILIKENDIEYEYELKSSLEYIEDAVDYIEEVRNANSILRDWGNELYETVDDLKSQINQYESIIEELRYEKNNLENIVNEMELKILELEERILRYKL